jgi:hypothetical protein
MMTISATSLVVVVSVYILGIERIATVNVDAAIWGTFRQNHRRPFTRQSLHRRCQHTIDNIRGGSAATGKLNTYLYADKDSILNLQLLISFR